LITAKVTYDKLMPKIDRLMPNEKDIAIMAIEGRKMIRDRTKQHQDADGNAFAPYSESYLLYRAKMGKTDQPNLEDRGIMLNSMAVKTISNGAEIYFADAERRDIARRHNEGRGVPKREFFGLSDSEIVRLLNALIKKLQARAAK
jgi:hypothetical protein